MINILAINETTVKMKQGVLQGRNTFTKGGGVGPRKGSNFVLQSGFSSIPPCSDRQKLGLG